MMIAKLLFQPLFTLPETVPAPFSDHGGPLETVRRDCAELETLENG